MMEGLYVSTDVVLTSGNKDKIVSKNGVVLGIFRSWSPPIIQVAGATSVNTTTCVAGDWFTSDANGLAVKTESGFALGRILEDPVDGLALCVVSPCLI